jgi:Ser/Thr protein kinase RdoA (MazF antagonist)
VNELLAHGIPDERPDRYREMLRAFTVARQLPVAERDRLKTLADDWDENGTGLTASLIPPSIQHGDLHDNNVAVDADGVSRFFDFGDSTVAHPFSTMDLPLLFAQDDGVDAAGIARLEDAYLDAFTEFAPRAELRHELRAVVAVAPLQRAHNWARALHRDDGTGSLEWDPKDAAEWDHPIEYWLSRLSR